jgi:Bacterial PH domain
MSNQTNLRSLEALIWQGKPAQSINIKPYTLYGLGFLMSLLMLGSWSIFSLIGMLTCAFFIFDKFVEARDTRYDLTHERIKIVSGGVRTQRQTFEIDIDDLIDVKLNESFFQQMSKTGDIILEFRGDPLQSSIYRDLVSKERHILQEVKEPQRAYEIIRAAIKKTLNTQTLDLDTLYDLRLESQSKSKPKLLK